MHDSAMHDSASQDGDDSGCNTARHLRAGAGRGHPHKTGSPSSARGPRPPSAGNVLSQGAILRLCQWGRGPSCGHFLNRRSERPETRPRRSGGSQWHLRMTFVLRAMTGEGEGHQIRQGGPPAVRAATIRGARDRGCRSKPRRRAAPARVRTAADTSPPLPLHRLPGSRPSASAEGRDRHCSGSQPDRERAAARRDHSCGKATPGAQRARRPGLCPLRRPVGMRRSVWMAAAALGAA